MKCRGIKKDTDKIKIYKAGYKKGAVVPRTLITQHDRIIKYYNTFCFKACASERIPQVKGFRERFIEIPMVEGYPEKEWTDIIEEDLERFHDLRNMLLKWRMLSREWQLPNPEVSIRGRLKEIWKPILQITHGLSVHPILTKFVEDQRSERLGRKQNTFEGHLVKVITEIHNEADAHVPHVPFPTVWLRLQEDLNGIIDDKKPHVMDTSEFYKISKQKVGYRIREVLSGKRITVRDPDLRGKPVKAWVFDLDKLRRVAKKYGYELVTKLPKLPLSEGVQTPNSTLKDYESNVKIGADTPLQIGNNGNSVTKPTTCWICHKLLPQDLKNTTVHEGKTCHIECFKNLKTGRVTHE